MGPTNVALVKLFRADQTLRAAQERYDSAARSVRILERKVNELSTRLASLQQALREQQAKAGNMELDLKTRDAHIEKLRTQQMEAKTHKEYQTFLTEINTQKVDRNKVEDQTIEALEVVERSQGEVKTLAAQLAEEQKRLDEVRGQLSGKLAELQAEIDAIRPSRDEAYNAVPPKARAMFDKQAERHDGEAMSALEKPSRRVEEYVCGACQMSLVVDVYNRLHSRDDMVMCTSCGRLLYIPEELPPEIALNKPKEKKEPKPRGGNVAASTNRQTSASDVLDSMMPEESAQPAGAGESGEQVANDTPAGQ